MNFVNGVAKYVCAQCRVCAPARCACGFGPGQLAAFVKYSIRPQRRRPRWGLCPGLGPGVPARAGTTACGGPARSRPRLRLAPILAVPPPAQPCTFSLKTIVQAKDWLPDRWHTGSVTEPAQARCVLPDAPGTRKSARRARFATSRQASQQPGGVAPPDVLCITSDWSMRVWTEERPRRRGGKRTTG